MCSFVRCNFGYVFVYKYYIWKIVSNLLCKLKEWFCKDCDKIMGDVVVFVRFYMNSL